MGIKEEEYFYASNGSILKNKEELLEFLRNTDEKTFSNHVNLEKNDFANWVRYVLKEKRLANKIEKAKTSQEMIDLIVEKIKPKQSKVGSKKYIISQLVQSIKNG